MKRAIFLTVLCFLTAVLGFTQINLQTAATVNLIRTQEITVGQLRAEIGKVEANPQQMQYYREIVARRLGRQPNPNEFSQALRREVLNNMINERLIIQGAEKEISPVNEADVTLELRRQFAQQNGRLPRDEAEFNVAIAQAVRASGLTEAAFRDQLRSQIRVQRYLDSKTRHLIEAIGEPTNAEITTEYDLIKTQLNRPDTVRLSIITIPYGPGAREEADRLLNQIGSNVSTFDSIFRRSLVPNSGYEAEENLYIPKTQEARAFFGQEFLNIAFSLPQGQVSGLIDGRRGFQIMKVTGNYEEKRLELSDPMDLESSITVREYIRQNILVQRRQAIILQVTSEIVAELRSGNPFTIFEDKLNW